MQTGRGQLGTGNRKLETSLHRIVILGGGISGLAAAHRLVERRGQSGPEGPSHTEVILLEASPRLGGVLRSTSRDGFLLESGPDCFITEKPWALDLCRRLGLEGEIVGTNPECRRSFIVRNGRLCPVPEGLYLLAPARFWPFAFSSLVSVPGKFRMLYELFVGARESDADESLAAFVRRRLGREALERLAQPMVAGIYTADPETLSLRATFPRFHQMEREHGSVIRALRAGLKARRAAGGAASGASASGPRYGLFATLRPGLQALADALTARLRGVTVRTGVEATGIGMSGRAAAGMQEVGAGPFAVAQDKRPSHRGEAGWLVRTATGEDIPADAVCLALPAARAAALVRGVDAELTSLLDGIPYASTITVHAAYRREDVPHPLDGFGFVTPAVERRDVLACTFASVKFPGRAPEGKVLLRAFVGGAARPDLIERDDAALEAAVRKDLRDLLGIGAAPLFVEVHRHPQSMAQYLVGHVERVAAIRARLATLPGLALAGNGYDGIGVPDCIRSGEAAADGLLT